MEAVGILVSLESQIAVMTGGRDREEHPLIFVSAPVENVPWSKECLDELLRYYISILSVDTRQQGITVIVDAQRSTWRLVRLCTRQVTQSLGNSIASIFVLRPDAFWDKQRVDNCAKIHKEGEPIYIPLSRLNKYVESSQLLPEYGGTWIYNHDRWIQNRIHVEEFVKNAEHAVSELERLRQRVGGTQRLRLSTAEEVLMDSAEMYDNIRELTQQVLTAGAHLTESLDADYSTGPCGTIMPQDILDTKEKIDRLVEIIEGKMILVQQAWIEMQKTIVDIKEVQAIEEGVQSVTDWILGPGETMLNCQKDVGHDITSAEELRRKHESLELECRNTYGHYAELLHKIDTLAHNGLTLPEDLKSQRDFMDFVCRSFASRLERRRNILITSARFFRLVSEYFQTTSDVYESLVMYTDIEALETAHCTLLELQESQMNIDLVETALVREGEKLSDLLSMPVKDALGRELLVDYTNDIINVREILDMTTARRQLFRDSVELQRLTLQQATHIHDYEKDAEQAIQWLDDLFQVMLRDHSHVGCNVSEIQLQKEEHQAFQETAKGTYEYGCQLLNAALSLRQSCKLPIDSNTTLSQNLWDAWKRLYNVVQEQLTRLRVSAVFHRSVQEHCRQLGELIIGVKNMALEEDVSNHRAKFRKFLSSRERLLLEVGRMVRLGRLLRTRLREPLCQQKMSDDGNTTAVEAISEKLAQVTGLAEELDAALCGSQGDNISLNINKILDGTASTTPEEWYSSLSKGLVKCGQEDSSKSEEDFVTASECTCTPPSRSSSFHTASEGETSSPWWEVDPASDQEHDVTKEPSQAKIIQVVVHQSFSETRHLKLSRTDGCSETTESVLREYCTDDASKSPQKVEDIITSVSSSDTISSVCQDVSEVISGNTEDVSSESSTVLQQMRQSIMPTFYKRKVGGKPRGEWGHDRLREAINRIQKDGMRFREAERYYRVPARTIERRMTTGNLNGPTCSLGPENEERLVKHIHRLCDAGFCPDKTIVHHVAYEFVVRLKINHKFNNEKKISRYVGFGSFFEGTPT